MIPHRIVVVDRRVGVVNLLLGDGSTALSVHPPLCPLRGEEGFFVLTVARELLPPLLHQALVALGNDEPALRLAVAVTVLISKEARRA
jgi:hypothetical protein